MKEQYKKIGNDENLNYALKLISRFSYSEFRLKKKLVNKGIDKEEINLIIDKLKKYKLIDDIEYTKNLIDLYISRHRGPNYIKDKLIEAGISIDIINDILNKINEKDLLKSLDDLINQLVKKYKKQNITDIKSKVLKTCIQKGYSYPMIIEEINKAKI